MKNTAGSERKETETSTKIQTETLPMTRPITGRIPEHGKAAARIFIEGLSVLCLNAADNSTEIAFVKKHHTPVKIGVYKNGCVPVWAFTCDINKKTKIEIKKSRPVAVGEFYEDSKKYNEDYGWMPDLTGPDWHNGADLDIKSTAKEHLSAKLVLKDATFYTRLNCLHDAEQENLNSRAKKNLSNLGRILGANIICDTADASVVITITTQDESGRDIVVDKTLPKDDGPYFIAVGTKPNESGSHLHLLYDYIFTPLPAGESRFDLKYSFKETDFNYCGVFGTASASVGEVANEETRYHTPAEDKVVVENTNEAEKGESIERADVRIQSIEFVCQTFGGGRGSLPDFP